jgi:hypothetical protein
MDNEHDHLPCNPFEDMPMWPLFLTKGGRAALRGMFRPAWEEVFGPPTPEVRRPVVEQVTCPVHECAGMVAVDGHCNECNIKLAAAIICPKCGWKQGVLNAEKFHFKCWNCKAEVADS